MIGDKFEVTGSTLEVAQRCLERRDALLALIKDLSVDAQLQLDSCWGAIRETIPEAQDRTRRWVFDGTHVRDEGPHPEGPQWNFPERERREREAIKKLREAEERGNEG